MDEADTRRVVWRSRRGMLELDLRLTPFARERYTTLSLEEQRGYRALLEHEDQDILGWLSGQHDAPLELASIVKLVREA